MKTNAEVLALHPNCDDLNTYIRLAIEANIARADGVAYDRDSLYLAYHTAVHSALMPVGLREAIVNILETIVADEIQTFSDWAAFAAESADDIWEFCGVDAEEAI